MRCASEAACRPLGVLAVGLLALQTPLSSAASEPFDAREATIDGVHNALFTGLTTCRGVVSSFLSRIETFNPTINAIISLNPDALSVADELDRSLAAGNVTGKLFCIPILLKDNYDATGMNTTGGNLDLAGNRPAIDAPTVKAFKNEGGIILGKANLHELALEGISVSSLGGQTINPYDHTRTPGGSSGGTGASIATSFAVFGTGTDTVNSLRSPASANSLVSVRPTRGLITRAGVVPISYTQDTVGPIARNIKDLAVALTVMASIGFDSHDNVTALAPPDAIGKDYSAELYGGSLDGLRLGVLDGFYNHTASAETSPVNGAMADMLDFLRAEGAEIVNVTDTLYNATAIAAKLDVQTSEYRQLLNEYLSGTNLYGTAPASFNELYTSGKFVVIPSQYNYVNTAFVSSTSNASYAVAKLGIQNLTTALRTSFSDHKLDAVIYPEQKNLVVKLGSPSQSGRNGILAALTGSPVVTVPAGFSPASEDAPIGVPIGMEILGLPFTEGKLLNIAAHITQRYPVRKMPSFANQSLETRNYVEVPIIKPDASNIPEQYPIGVLA
ncbi:amidase signature domain-containing protein [Truncatella angustata]|uniref:Amidase signature domain-containing protein n=1 Tax=Truncatella angustata TaxID=152316 RepID=A0A9P8UDU8_9PEZI|nr:amidase signature domain-containing protein [Truncatella angustata]KAH6648103.1 amidase signature domain-containing protein [Truncatella angustata]